MKSNSKSMLSKSLTIAIDINEQVAKERLHGLILISFYLLTELMK